MKPSPNAVWAERFCFLRFRCPVRNHQAAHMMLADDVEPKKKIQNLSKKIIEMPHSGVQGILCYSTNLSTHKLLK